MQIQQSLFSYTGNCQDVECRILSFLPKKALLTCAKVSKAWCAALDSMVQPYLEASQLNPRSIIYERKALSKLMLLGFYSNLILYRIDGKRYPVNCLTKCADISANCGNYQPWIYLALNSIEEDDIQKTYKICDLKIITQFKDGSLITYFIDRLCKSNKIKDAIDFHKKYFVDILHLSEMESALEKLKDSLLAQQNWPLLQYLVDENPYSFDEMLVELISNSNS